jgi:MFS family permease
MPDPTLTAQQRESVYRRNFALLLTDYMLFSIALNLIGPTTVIPDFVRKLTSSEILIAVSSQLFEIGWLLPQLLVARRLVRVERKKWWFVGPNIPVRTLILIFSGVIVLLGPEQPGMILAAFLFFYALAALGDGLVGVPWMDFVGSSLDDRRRARMFGLGNAAVGVTILGLAPLAGYILSDNGPGFPNNYALLFALSGALFLITVPIVIPIRELPDGKPAETIPPMSEYLPGLVRVLRQDVPFRAVVIARVLVALATLAAPFYIGFATERLGLSSDVAVSRLLLMQTLGSVGGALAFSRLGDGRSVQFMVGALLFAIAQPILALVASVFGPTPLYAAFLMNGVALGCLGISFINWVIAHPSPEQRPVYAGLFNSLSALSLIVAPLVGGTLVEVIGYEAAFGAALACLGGALAVFLRHYTLLRAT